MYTSWYTLGCTCPHDPQGVHVPHGPQGGTPPAGVPLRVVSLLLVYLSCVYNGGIPHVYNGGIPHVYNGGRASQPPYNGRREPLSLPTVRTVLNLSQQR